MELEQIVKLYVPFSGVHYGKGFRGGNIVLPDPLIETLKKRQKAEEDKVQLFYRLHAREVPIYIELTDYLPPNGHTNLANYFGINFDNRHRFHVPEDVLKNTNFTSEDDVVFVGGGNKIWMYSSSDYKRYEQSGFNIYGPWNRLMGITERFRGPEVVKQRHNSHATRVHRHPQSS